VTELCPGQIGVMTCNMKSPREAIIGDTFYAKSEGPMEPLMDLQRPRPMVFAGVYPMDASEHSKLKNAIDKVCLNDFSVTLEPESNPGMGLGWRVGFLGLLHMEVFSQRLEDEYDAQVLITTPSVPYKLKLTENSPTAKLHGKDEIEMTNPSKWPAVNEVKAYYEPFVKATIICPVDYQSDIFGLCSECRGTETGYETIDSVRVKLEFLLPLNEIVVNFFDRLKSKTSGFGSFDYEDAGYEESSLTKVNILLNDNEVPELSTIVHTSHVKERSSQMVEKLVDLLPRQQFKIKVQAATGSKIWARGDVKPYRKDVLAKLKTVRGDEGRVQKLLKNQKKGKARMRSIGNIELLFGIIYQHGRPFPLTMTRSDNVGVGLSNP